MKVVQGRQQGDGDRPIESRRGSEGDSMAEADGVPERSRIVAAAIDQMAEGGLDSVTVRAIATRLAIAGETIQHHFPDRRHLHDAMTRLLLAESWDQPGTRLGWQDWLRLRARSSRGILLRHRDAPRLAAGTHLADGRSATDGSGPFRGSGFSPERAQDAIQMIDRFAIGWCLEESVSLANGNAIRLSSREAEFEFGLEVLIAGLGAVGPQMPPAALRMRRRMVTMGIWALLRHVRQSSDLAYARLIDLGELDRRLLMEVHAGTVARSADLIALSGLDKAQVSRAVRRLTAEGLLARDDVRGPFRLTNRGRELGDEFIRIARRQNAELVDRVDAADLDDFSLLVAEMTARAILLLDQEQSLDPSGFDRIAATPSDLGAIVSPGQNGLVIPPLSTLFSYMQRSGKLMIRRLAGMSNFEWLVMSTIGELGPLTPVKLIASVERDHSQARRTLRWLIEIGLVERYSEAAQRGRLLRLTENGRDVARRLDDEGWRRDTMLFGSFDPERLERFRAVVARLTENALAELERQRQLDR